MAKKRAITAKAVDFPGGVMPEPKVDDMPEKPPYVPKTGSDIGLAGEELALAEESRAEFAKVWKAEKAANRAAKEKQDAKQ